MESQTGPSDLLWHETESQKEEAQKAISCRRSKTTASASPAQPELVSGNPQIRVNQSAQSPL